MRLPDINYQQLDPGVRRLVQLLREAGFETIDSGDGVSKPEDERALHFPHVFCRVPVDRSLAEADRLLELVRGLLQRRAKPLIEVNYDPAERLALLMLFDVSDADLPDPPSTPDPATR